MKKADEMEKRLKNALIYGTSHPEAYMTKAEALAALVGAVQREHGGEINNPKCPICIAINALNKEKNNG